MAWTRRSVIGGAVAATGAALAPRWLRASVDLGGMTVDTLSDGHLVLPAEFILGPMPQAEAGEILSRHGLAGDTLTPPCNVTLMRDGTNTVLFDCGSGLAFQPTAGTLPEALDALGIAPEDVTHVVFTHAHPDHLWGVLDDFDDPFFPDAALLIGRQEWAYWTDPETVDTIGAERQSFAVGAARRLAAVEDRIDFFDAGDAVLPGVEAVSTPGHTPGHMAFALHAGGGGLMVVGDAIGNHHVAFERPDWPSGSDQDLDTARATRVALLDRLAADGMPLIGFHLPGGGLGRAERAGGAYRFVPG